MATLSISQAWNETTAFLKREAGLVFPVALLLLAVPSAAMQLAMPVATVPGQPPEMGAWALLFPLVLIASLVAGLAISHLALRPGASVAESLQVGVRRFLPLFLATLLIFVAAMVIAIPLMLLLVGSAALSGNVAAAAGGFLLFFLVFFVLALAAWVKLMFITPIAAAEQAGPIEILRRSWNLTKGHFWKLLGFVLLLFIVAMVVMIVVSMILGLFVMMLFGGQEPGSTSYVLMTIISALLSAVFSAVMMILLARIYVQLSGSVPTDVFA